MSLLTRAIYDKAIADCNRAIQLEPKKPLLTFDRGLIYRKKGDRKHALADFTEAIRLNPRVAHLSATFIIMQVPPF